LLWKLRGCRDGGDGRDGGNGGDGEMPEVVGDQRLEVVEVGERRLRLEAGGAGEKLNRC